MTLATEAAKRMAMRQKGGIRGMAAVMGMDANLLYHKLDEQRPEKLSLVEAELMTGLAQDAEIAASLAQACGHICVSVGLVGEVSDTELTKIFLRLCKEQGDVAASLNRALADGSISRNEERHLDQQIEELIQAAVELRRRVHAKAACDAAAPRPLAKR